jgi:transposase
MIRPGFLDRESRQDLIELARDGSAAHRLARRTNALELLDDGMSCEAIAKVLLLDDDTIRSSHRLYEEDGISDFFANQTSTSRPREASVSHPICDTKANQDLVTVYPRMHLR